MKKNRITKLVLTILTLSLILPLEVGYASSDNVVAQSSPASAREEPVHRTYLKQLLANTGLRFTAALRDAFTYYELYTAYDQLAGFVFLGHEMGWAGPIDLFVKTNAVGVIQRVHVWRHTETPKYVVGLDEFLATFTGHKAAAELIWQEDVHGITGATVTAEAIIAAVNRPGRVAYRTGIFIQPEQEREQRESSGWFFLFIGGCAVVFSFWAWAGKGSSSRRCCSE
jgi:Na+-translocating ferredoxin:NAD+ oxidoreductase RnfG subunit